MSYDPILRMYLPGDLQRPVSVRYYTQGRFGWSQQTLTFDLFGMGSNPSKIPGALWELWSRVVAPATSYHTSLIFLEYIDWKAAPAPLPYVGLPASGLYVEPSSPRDQQLCIIMHTGHADDFAARRLFSPGMPASWTDGEVLTERGWDRGMLLVNALAMGALAWYTGGEVSLLLTYFGVYPSTVGNLLGVGMRLVSDLRLCQYVDKAPELTTLVWP